MRKSLWWATVPLVAAAGAAHVLRPRPVRTPDPNPATDYAGALARVQKLQAADGAEIKPICRTRLYTHGERRPTAVVLLHGYSSSPHQYHVLAPQLFARGHNVLVPRFPYHGYVSRTYADFWRMPLEAVIDTVWETVDIAQGLGERVIVLGLSFGGELTAWLAQHRADIARAVIVSPALGFSQVRGWKRRPAAGLGRYLRPRFVYWDAELKDAGGVYHAYAGWSSRGAAEMMRLGLLLDRAARRAGPKARAVTVALNPADRLLDLDPVHSLVNRWQAHDPTVDLYVFPAEWGLRHDLIEPDAENAQIERVNPVLVELAERGLDEAAMRTGANLSE